MTTKKIQVTVPKEVALKHRFRFHAYYLVLVLVLPMYFYSQFFYVNITDLLKYDLPVSCLLSFEDQQPWWMIPPPLIFLGGFPLYWAFVWIFSDKKDESTIINLVKNSDPDAMVEISI